MTVQHSDIPCKTPYWSAILSLFMGVTCLISAEFLPISLLTPIAHDLHITEGQTGQAVTAVGIFAVITSLLIAPISQKINKKTLLLSFSVLVIFSNSIVAITDSYYILLLGRCLLGICVGGFWSLTSAVVLDLAPTKDVPRALSIIYAGVSIATIISLPFANYLALLLGWRMTFYLAALLGVITLIWQTISLPQLPVSKNSNFNAIFALTQQPWVCFGLFAIFFSFSGYHVVFTYLRPFIEGKLHFTNNALSLTLLGFGIINCLGTFMAGLILNKSFRSIMVIIHVVLCIVAIFFYINNQITADLIKIMLWGFIFGIIPVGWSTWITRTLADRAEIAGGLMVAAIQFSITLAAAVGGMIFDHYGLNGLFIASTTIFIFAILCMIISFSLFYKATGKHV
ncbi:MFS family (AraJ) (PDB:4LDS) [Commensalibacter communis]|uniref:MFS transporter n=1 Tax=Commensalibacter communis TaxID=2972786 RepID=UPI0022FF97F0|nr:MFS transporter [Commensalibacter communis]CAI3953244.1 MFS family (AraJ) (PDB:4LDS) [Commensalibacter communis]